MTCGRTALARRKRYSPHETQAFRRICTVKRFPTRDAAVEHTVAEASRDGWTIVGDPDIQSTLDAMVITLQVKK
jgi:hypothetical protein